MSTNTAYLPGKYNTGIVRGDYFSEQFGFTVDGVPLDLADATARIQIRKRDGSLLGEFTLDAGLEIADGKLIWSIPSLATTSYTPGTYQYDIEVTINSEPRTYVAGTFTVAKDQTR
jgi:hypothetical protein